MKIAGLIFALLAFSFAAQAQTVVTSGGKPVTSSGGSPLNTPSSYVNNILATELLQWGTSTQVYYSRLSDAIGTTAPLDSGPNGFTQSVSGTVTFGSTPLVLSSKNTSALLSSSGTIDLGSAAQTYFHGWDYTQPFHIEAVIKPNFNRASGTLETGTIWSKGTSGGAGIFFFAAFDNGHTNRSTQTTLELDLCSATCTTSLKVYASTDLQNGKIYHVAADYDGSGAIAGLTLWINGARELVGSNGTTLSSTIVNSVDPYVGSMGGSANYFKGNIQEVSVWSASHPAGYATNLSISHTNSQDVAAWYHASLQAGAAGPPANPPTKPNVIIEDDMRGDIDGVQELAVAMWLHENNYINLLALVINSGDTYSASTVKAILNYNGLSSIPVYSYQGATDTGGTLYTQATATNFRSQDGTNVGILNSGYSITGGGTLYQVGDVLTVPGGTLASGFSAATVTVTSVSSGAITGIRMSNSGSYSSAPSSPVTLPNPHGGTAATMTFTTGTWRGNYPDAQSALIDLLNANSNIYWFNSGVSSVIYQFITANSSLFASKVSAYLVEAGWYPNNRFIGVNAAEANYGTTPSQWNYILANWPSSTIPYIVCGDENVTPLGNSGLVYGGPSDVLNKATDPVQYAFYTAGVNGETFVSGYLRPAWTLPCLLYLASGISPAGSGYAQDIYWGATGGTGTVNATTGFNTYSNSWGFVSYMRIRAAYATLNSLLVTIMAAISPG